MITGLPRALGAGWPWNYHAGAHGLVSSPARSDLLAEIIQQSKRKEDGLCLAADVQDAAAMKEVAKQLQEQFGPIDMLIANAGIGTTTDAANLEANSRLPGFLV